jgi:hypothetical protein
MKLKISLILCLALVSQLLHSQAFHTTYNWDEHPDYSTEGLEDEKLLAYFKKVTTDFQFEKSDLVEFELEHNIYYVNSDEAIEAINKMYLPVGQNASLVTQKARVITPNGQINELDDTKLLTANNEETGQKVTYFAFEGIEKGSFIEYYYVIKKNPNVYGNRVSIQAEYPIKTFEFDVFSPENLVFKFKSFNGLQEVEVEELENQINWSLVAKDMPALVGEEYAAPLAEQKFLIYALDKNLASNMNDITVYSDIAKNLFSIFNEELKRGTEKDLDKLAKEIGINKLKEDEQKIRAIENFIKRNFYLRGDGSKSLSDLDEVLDTKLANDKGIMHLYLALFKREGIAAEIVITSNRNNMRFDKEFEAYNYLKEYLIYFPKTENYLSPEDADSRFPYPNYNYTDNYGLFISSVKIGDFVSAVSEIKYINPLPMDKNIDGIHMKVRFDEKDMSTIHAELNKSFFGYTGMFIHPYIDLVKEEDRTNLAKNILESFTENAKDIKVEFNNDDPALFGIKPLELIYTFNTNDLVKKAGNKYLFNMGRLIGRQIEMYEEKERNLPIAERHHRTYDRLIEIEIPEGYQITNLEDINIENTIFEDEEAIMHFKSYYSLEGNTLKVIADEFYQKNYVPVEEYENYRKVINSAADFNEITLILEPTS